MWEDFGGGVDGEDWGQCASKWKSRRRDSEVSTWVCGENGGNRKY